MRVAVATVAGLVALAVAAPATAAELELRDREGRPVHFDVRAAGADANWYAGILRNVDHSDEISRLTIRIVEWDELSRTCGRSAAGCYSSRRGRDLLVVPAGQSRRLAHTLVHEYGHHVDAGRRHGGLREPNGTPLWWKARGLAELVRTESVARSYRLGWERSIGEIFAEDYAYLNVGGPYRIDWLRPPPLAVRAAIRADLGLRPPPPVEAMAPARRPIVIIRTGTLAPSQRESVQFGLLGPDRRVTFSASLPGPGRLTVSCEGAVRTRTIPLGVTSATLDLRDMGPGSCRAVLSNTGSQPASFHFRLRLAVPG
jgi:hypothetical protein